MLCVQEFVAFEHLPSSNHRISYLPTEIEGWPVITNTCVKRRVMKITSSLLELTALWCYFQPNQQSCVPFQTEGSFVSLLSHMFLLARSIRCTVVCTTRVILESGAYLLHILERNGIIVQIAWSKPGVLNHSSEDSSGDWNKHLETVSSPLFFLGDFYG